MIRNESLKEWYSWTLAEAEHKWEVSECIKEKICYFKSSS